MGKRVATYGVVVWLHCSEIETSSGWSAGQCLKIALRTENMFFPVLASMIVLGIRYIFVYARKPDGIVESVSSRTLVLHQI